MDNNHTPGPWVLYEATEFHGPYVMDYDGINTICDMYYKTDKGYGAFPKCEDNARLIAAAPELLEALERLWAISDPFCTPDSLIDYIDEAISKAGRKS